MEISGDTISETKRSRTIYVVVGVFLVALISFYFVFQYRFLRLARIFDRSNRDNWSQLTGADPADVAIYIIADSSTVPKGDIRTRFWEPHMRSAGYNLSVKYVADMAMPTIANVPWIVPSACADKRQGCDPGYCYRNIESWGDYMKTQRQKPWYFKGFQDTFVNVPNLLRYIRQLSSTIDPFSTPYFAYTIDEENGQVTPDGITGWLISHAGVTTLFDHAQHFAIGCSSRGEDVGMAEMIHNMQLEVDSFISPYFIANWPDNTDTVIGDGDMKRVHTCPSKQYRTAEKIEVPFENVARVVATRMQEKDMEKVVELLKVQPDEYLRIGYQSANEPVFCLA